MVFVGAVIGAVWAMLAAAMLVRAGHGPPVSGIDFGDGVLFVLVSVGALAMLGWCEYGVWLDRKKEEK